MTIPTSNANFRITYHNNQIRLQIPERLTVLEAVAFKDICHQILNQEPLPQQLVFDFERTIFMDSSGLGALVHNLKATKDKGVELILYNVSPSVMAVLSMTGLDRVFRIRNPISDNQGTTTQPIDLSLPETHPSIRCWIKRGLDIVGSLIGLVITGIIFIPIAIAIKWNSPGPIFFTQTRCGWMGKPFKIVKFRSMCVEAEKLKDTIPNQAQGAFFKNKNDPRVTKVGRFLRRTSLDELPQFWNVLTGDMSLVGTRPPTPDEVSRYEIPAWQRLNVKPGMTGEWQVNGRSRVRDFEDVIKLDLRYQENWSLKYDVQLILKTILILFHKNSGAF